MADFFNTLNNPQQTQQQGKLSSQPISNSQSPPHGGILIHQPYNKNKKSSSRLQVKIFGVLAVMLFLIGLPLFLLATRTRQETQQHAAASSTLAFIPISQTLNSGDPLSADISIDPGTNQVSVVQLAITYDSSQLQISSAANGIGVNTSIFPQTLAAPSISCTGTQCTLTATYSVGSNPLNAITTKTTFATLHAVVAAPNGTPLTVGFNQSTAVFSVASTDQANENVLASSQPLSFTVGGTTATASPTLTTTPIPGPTSTPSPTPTNTPSNTPTPTACSGPGTVSNLHIVCPNCNN